MRRNAITALALFALLAAGCSPDKDEEDAGTAKPADTSDVDGVLDAGPSDGTGPVDVPVADSGVDGGDKPGDIVTTPDGGDLVDSAVDAGPACQVVADCADKLTTKACEELACTEGQCVAVVKANSCCVDLHCNDDVPCTVDKCNAADNTCGHTPIPNCCKFKQSSMNAKFESGSMDDLMPKEGATNGNVKWQVSDKRAHTGKSSLYFGNDCFTYDNAMSPKDRKSVV